MRILVFCNKDIKNPKAGGGTWELFRILKRLISWGHDVTLLCGNFKGGSREDEIDGVKICRVGNVASVFFLAPLKYITSKDLRSCDLIIDVALMGVPFFTPLYTKKPIIMICWHLPRETFFIELCRKLNLLGFLLASFLIFIEDVVAPRIYRHVPVITFSHASKMDLKATGYRYVFSFNYALCKEIMFLGKKEENIADLASIEEKEGRELIIVSIGRLKRYKGIQDLIYAMSFIVKKVPNAALFIIGRGDYLDELKKLVDRLLLKNHVKFLGFLPVKEKFNILKRSRVLVMTSYKEGFATPILEAYACKKPVVGINAPGTRELIIHGQTGFLYPYRPSFINPKGDVHKITEYIIRLITNEQLSKNMGERGYSFLKQIDIHRHEVSFFRFFSALLKQMAEKRRLKR